MRWSWQEDPDGYGEKAYWDDRYTENAKGPTFEWYLGWAGLKDDIIGALSKASAPVDPASSVLMVGCGNSRT